MVLPVLVVEVVEVSHWHGNTKRALMDLMYSSPYLHCEVAVLFSLNSQNQSPQPALSHSSLPVDSEVWEAQSGQMLVLTSSSMESLLCLLMEVSLTLKPTTRSAEHRVRRTRSWSVATGSLGVILMVPPPFPPLDPRFLTYGFWLLENEHFLGYRRGQIQQLILYFSSDMPTCPYSLPLVKKKSHYNLWI